MDLSAFPTAAMYILLAVTTAGFGVGMLVWQTGATQRTVANRGPMLAGGVLLVLVGGIVLLTQIWAIVNDSYGTIR